MQLNCARAGPAPAASNALWPLRRFRDYDGNQRIYDIRRLRREFRLLQLALVDSGPRFRGLADNSRNLPPASRYPCRPGLHGGAAGAGARRSVT